ncbi:hypothetical protein BJY00DRAFT_290967 [Aspergillus carlsbadensis]|nr:hypothetical protein BJY00DRAFT_290967 [Aspergillus carlsbadensis]
MYFKKGTYANWCNDSDKKRSLPSHNNVADALQVILNECQRDGGWVSGVVNHPDLWRASVHNEWSTTNKLADLQ